MWRAPSFDIPFGILVGGGSGSGSGSSIQVSTMPIESSTNLGIVVQYIGTAIVKYTEGYFYECVSDGESTPIYSWEQVNVQPFSSNSNNSDPFPVGTKFTFFNDK